MPARLTVRLARRHGQPPAHRGPALRAALLKTVEASDPALSAWMHPRLPAADRRRPYALTLLQDTAEGARFAVHVLAADTGPHRRSAKDITVAIQHALADLDGSDSQRVFRVLHATYTVTDVEASFEPYSQLARAAPHREWALQLLSPTTKRADRWPTGRRNQPLPVPEMVFASLLERWHHHGGPPLPALAGTVLDVGLEVATAHLDTTDHLCKEPDTYLTGCTGTITYRAVGPLRADPDACTAISALARFATYAGIGDETPVGMGWVELQAIIQDRDAALGTAAVNVATRTLEVARTAVSTTGA